MSGPLRIIIIPEETGFAATCLEDLDFMLFSPTLEGIKEALPAALEGYFRGPVAYWIVGEPERFS